MSSTYHIHADLLDENFLASLKTLYKGRTLEITVEAEQDETERILANPALLSLLQQAVQDLAAGKGIPVPFEQIVADAQESADEAQQYEYPAERTVKVAA
jgi:hypothetical protein